MNSRPFFSVLMPVYDGAEFLADALASLRAQEPFEGGWEAIAADDGSRDESRDILEAAAKEMPLRVIDGAQRGNWVASTNKALAESRGEWIVFLHQDDAFAPARLRRLRGGMKVIVELLDAPNGSLGKAKGCGGADAAGRARDQCDLHAFASLFSSDAAEWVIPSGSKMFCVIYSS